MRKGESSCHQFEHSNRLCAARVGQLGCRVEASYDGFVPHCVFGAIIIYTASVLWSVGYAMDHLDGVRCIHPSHGIHIYFPSL